MNTKRKINRRGLKKNKRSNHNIIGKELVIVGINAAGITSKLYSFDKLIFDLKPSVWLMQESKRNATDPVLRTTNLINDQVFEMKRVKSKEEGGKGIHGGGLAVGALHHLNPVLIRNGNDDIECVTIEITTETARIRCVTGYGPQESDCTSRKEKFWNFLDAEVHSAMEDDVGLVIEIDSNAWAGDRLIPNDPNKKNYNCKLLEKVSYKKQKYNSSEFFATL